MQPSSRSPASESGLMAGHDLITGVGIEGDLGTVTGVDDTGAVLVDWDSGARFALTPGQDRWEHVYPARVTVRRVQFRNCVVEVADLDDAWRDDVWIDQTNFDDGRWVDRDWEETNTDYTVSAVEPHTEKAESEVAEPGAAGADERQVP
jgi:hypothetical protein